MRYRPSSFVGSTRSTPIFLLVSVLVAVGALALFQNVSPAGEQMMAPSPSLAPTAGVPVIAQSAVTWTVPAAWRAVAATSEEPRPLAAYRIDAFGADAENAVATVDQATGSPESCLDRAAATFGEVSRQSRSEQDVRGLRVRRLEIRGTFLATTPGNRPVARSGYALLVAVVEASQGSYVFQMGGVARKVDAARDAFEAMIESITQGE